MLGRIFGVRSTRQETGDLPRYRVMKNGLDEYIVQELTRYIDGDYYYKTVSEYLPSLEAAKCRMETYEKRRSWEVVTPEKA